MADVGRRARNCSGTTRACTLLQLHDLGEKALYVFALAQREREREMESEKEGLTSAVDMLVTRPFAAVKCIPSQASGHIAAAPDSPYLCEATHGK